MASNYVGKSIPGFPQRADDFPDSLQGVEAACVESRMAADTMNSEERAAFPQYNSPNKKKEYLYIRNQILTVWNDNPGQEVTLENATTRITKIEYQNPALISKILMFLIRRGKINHGVFREAPKSLPVFSPRKEHVAIIGGGISGIIAAKQLRYYGFKVTVFEAMLRFGGRICTIREHSDSGNPWMGELGAQVITGLPGNPIHTLSKQFRFDLKKIRNECPLWADGIKIDRHHASADKKIEDLFNKILEGIVSLRDKEQFAGKDYSLGLLVEKFLDIQEATQRETLLEHRRDIQTKYEKLLEIEKKMSAAREKMTKHSNTMENLLQQKRQAEAQNNDDEMCVYHYYWSKDRVALAEKLEVYDDLVQERDELARQVADKERNEPPSVFINAFERRIIDWHIANLEYANAASIDKLSMKNWDQDDAYEFPGDHYVITNGYDVVVDQLVQKAKDVGVEFKLGRLCKMIKMQKNEGKVELSILDSTTNFSSKDGEPSGEPNAKMNRYENEDNENEQLETEIFDTVLCTVPLGILKSGDITFEPELPDWKLESIKRLGFGNLNKVLLYFEERFWDDKLDTFGFLGPSSSCRGEFYLFFSTSKKEPVLTVLLSGESANTSEECSDDLIIRRAITLLKEVFGSKVVARTRLKGHRISRWSKNPAIKGAYSYMAVGASGDDYDYLAAPVHHGKSTIYFAGEHTNRHYPSSVHGAYLSGLREAGRIADNYLDTPYNINKSVRPEA